MTKSRIRTAIAAGLAAAGLLAASAPAPFTAFRSSVPEWKPLWHLVRSTLSLNRVSFPGRTGVVEGFAAGALYPQIWIRDAATIIPASKYVDGAPRLTSWLVEHLSLQTPEGGLSDWIDARGRSDKNTTETDQESGAVLAAARIAEVVGTDWLTTSVLGVPVIDRLDRALGFVLEHRFDAARGLVTGAHTADWGDVGLGRSDQSAIYVHRDTQWTGDIYDQSLFHGAARALAGMLRSLKRSDRAATWTARAEAVQEAADRHLWQEARGFYRVHVHLGDFVHPFDEDDMFALGGNVEAVLSGLAGPEKAARIIRTALDRQAAFAMPTVSAVLLPPYPKGFFLHPMVDDPWEYQNGGLWDWFGGKLVRIMFDHGFSVSAKEKLLEIARKAMANGGLHEWDSPDGKGNGSPAFAGSAGSLAGALIEGYFGVRLSRDSLDLELRLGGDQAEISVRLPAADVWAYYDYDWNPVEASLTLRYEGNITRKGRIRLLLPDPLARARSGLRVLRDGLPLPFEVEALGEDVLLSVSTDFKPHSLLIRSGAARKGSSLP